MLFRSDPAAHPRYSRVLELDLMQVGMHIAGPRRPQDLLDYGDSARVLREVCFAPRSGGLLPPHAVAIAAITSCTNTSDPRLLIAAGLVARKARALGLKVPHWVKTSLAPGSPAAASYLQRAGLLDDLEAIGYAIVGFGCTTCIGNPGRLTDPIREAQREQRCKPVAILSGNRNFPGRVHPDIELSFIMSPPLVVIFGLAGDAARNLRTEPIQVTADGRSIRLEDLWPTHEEISVFAKLAANPLDYRRDFAVASRNPQWFALAAPQSARFPWNPDSTTLRRPPFVTASTASADSRLGEYRAHPLLVLGDDITTDHISPASAIPPDSLVADFLVARGEDRADLNVFASRRGNWEVMMRAAFHSKTLKNLFCESAPVAHTLHVPSGEVLPIWEVAERYREARESTVLVAGERYGTGSSRDWAAKGQRLLGIRAVLAMSFERIHRSNLIGMGILPLRLPRGVGPDTLRLSAGDQIEVVALPHQLTPRCDIAVRIIRAGGVIESLTVVAAVETQLEAELLRNGGVIPLILRRTIEQHTKVESGISAAAIPAGG